MQKIDMIGKRFGRLTVVEETEPKHFDNGRKECQYICECDCGCRVTVLGCHLRSDHTSSCGCYRKDATSKNKTTHGETDSRLYTIWKNMKRRCYNKNCDDYKFYGERGIVMCDDWKNSFSSFMNWATSNGYDDCLTIDRIDVNDGYKPSNCRWATIYVQHNNMRNNVSLHYNGETHTIKEWSDKIGVNYGTLYSRLQRGWSVDRALSE